MAFRLRFIACGVSSSSMNFTPPSFLGAVGREKVFVAPKPPDVFDAFTVGNPRRGAEAKNGYQKSKRNASEAKREGRQTVKKRER